MSTWTKRFAKMALGVMVVGMLAGCGSSSVSPKKTGDQFIGKWWSASADPGESGMLRINVVTIDRTKAGLVLSRTAEDNSGKQQLLIDKKPTEDLSDKDFKINGLPHRLDADGKTLFIPSGYGPEIPLTREDANTEATKQKIREAKYSAKK